MLYNTYRPKKFSEVVGQKDVIDNLLAQSQKEKFFGVYILCGQFGSGKTTTARILAMAANCQHKDENGDPCGECESCRAIREGTAVDVQEIAAAVNTGVDKVREICDTVSYLPVVLRKKVYIIDEVQALSKSAFQAFLKMLEEPPAHAMFILATTDVGAIPPTVRSRSATYYFKQLTQTEISGHCKKVALAERFSITDDACDVIAKYSGGSMRNALSLLDMAAQDRNGEISGETVEKLLGVSRPDMVFSVVESIMEGNAAEVIRKTTELSEGGADLSVLVNDMLSIVADLSVASIAPDSVTGTACYLNLVKKTVLCGSSTRFTALAEELFRAKQMMSRNPELSVLLVALVRAARRTDIVKYQDAPAEETRLLREMVQTLIGKVSALEEQLLHGKTVFLKEDSVSSEVVPVEAPVDVPIEVCEVSEMLNGCESETSEDIPAVAEEMVSEDDFEEESEAIEEPELHLLEESEAEEASGPDAATEKNDKEKETTAASGSEESKEVTVAVSSSEEDEEEMDIFSFLGLSKEDAAPKKGEASKAWKNLEELGSVPMIRAALSCCETEERADEVIIATKFPVAKRFLASCLGAFSQQGYDITGITIAE